MSRAPFLALALLILAAMAHAAPTMTAVPRQGDIAVDGRLDEAAWGKASWQTNFVSAAATQEAAGAPKPVAVQTRFKVLYDPDVLYLAAECDEPLIDRVQGRYTDHDGMIFMDDCLELFLDPAGEGRYYHHFVVNVNGAWYDDTGADYGLVHAKLWECPLQTGVTIDAAAQVWRMEVRLPLAGLQLREDAGSTWLWNVTRERQATGTPELSTWAPLKSNFHQPKLFGKLTDVKADYSRFAVTVGEPKSSITGGAGGTHDIALRVPVTNGGQQPRKLAVAAEAFLQPQTAVKAEPVTIAAGATETVSLPPLRVARDLLDAVVQLTVTDADTGAPAKIAVKHLSAEYQPLALDITQPVYRNCFYATEQVLVVSFSVKLADDIAGQTAEIAYDLTNEAGQRALPGAATVAQAEKGLSLPARGLPVGRYTLSVRALDKQGQAVAETKTTIRRLGPAPGVEVRVDAKGNVVVNGKPRVFCGWYGDMPLEDPRPEVIALQDLQTPAVVGVKPEDMAPVRRLFQDHGIYSIVSIEPGRLFYAFELWRKPGNTVAEEIKKLAEPSEECVGYLKQLVEAVRDEPAVLGYYLADEPEINDARSDYLEAVYKLMQELDPYRPVMITNDTLDGIVTHGYKACDLLSPDPYSPAWEYVPNFLKRCHEVLRRGQAIMMTPWASSIQAHFNQEYGSAPPYPYAVMRHQYLTAIAMGCRGFTGYTTSFFMPEPLLRYGLPPIWREVRFLEAAMADPQAPPTVKADAEMIAWAGQSQGKAYLIVSNLKAGARSATVSHPLLRNLRSLDVVSEARTVQVANGAFTDSFEEGAVHVYSTDAEGRKLPTIGDVAADIKAQEAAGVKPGNLLHSSRGVLARAAEGYFAPWFMQYYYYAINGITDDRGWQLSHTDKPSWLELTLPREERVGKVVIYTPNLKDYDLQLQAADGSAQVAEVRGSNATMVEHRFAAPVATLKLRVTALASADGPGTAKATVREIEAYTEPGVGPPTPLRQAQAATPAPTLGDFPEETAGEPTLWREDFTAFQTAAKFNWDGQDDKWVLAPANLKVEPRAGGGAVIACAAPVGYASMQRFFPADRTYRYLQAAISDITGEGYRWALVMFGDSSGKPGFRGGIHTMRPGIYTLDTHYVNPVFRDGTAKQAFVTLSTAGSAKQPDGGVTPGPAFTFDWLQLVRRPRNGLAVTMGDGAPLPEALKQGDELLFRLFLDKPALDAALEVSLGPSYSPVPINGQGSLQLARVGAKDGTEWAARVTLGEGTGKADGATGYPIFFRAVITGGEIKDAYAVAAVKFE